MLFSASGNSNFIQALINVPVQEDLEPDHGRELLRDLTAQLPGGHIVSFEGGWYVQAMGHHGKHGSCYLVGKPVQISCCFDFFTQNS